MALAGSSTVDVDITEREIVKFSVGTSGTSTFLGNVSHSASDSLFGSLSDPKSLLSLSSWSSQIDNSSGWHSKGPPLDKKKVQLDKCDNLLYFNYFFPIACLSLSSRICHSFACPPGWLTVSACLSTKSNPSSPPHPAPPRLTPPHPQSTWYSPAELNRVQTRVQVLQRAPGMQKSWLNRLSTKGTKAFITLSILVWSVV